MEKIRYKEIVDKNAPKSVRFKNGVRAFLIGGFVGMLGDFLMQLYAYLFHIPTKEASVFMIITLIFFGCLFTALGFFDNFVKYAKAGLIIPITGFAHATMSATLEYAREGLVTGIGANMLKLSGSVIIFGVISAYFFGLVRLIFFGG
ncbi:MAG: SpoVA/SpoVAEb family sporulation membrane protein [Bacilli bacterium]|nr:SpoVA/SpoVAEb family sporulation membrane protein [Bacilli bacterium]